MGPVTQSSKLFILHGWAYSAENWEPFLKLLKQSRIAYELLKIPGLTAPLKEVWTLDDYVAWLARTSDIEHPISILGHSNGGRIAAAFTAKYPEKIASLMLVDSAGIIDKRIKTNFKKIIFKTLASVGGKITTQKTLRALIYRLAGEQDYNKADPALKKTMMNLISRDLSQDFDRIKVPTLIIWGENDRVTPLSDGKKIHHLISGSELFVVKDAKHSPQFSHPGRVAGKIEDFISHHQL